MQKIILFEKNNTCLSKQIEDLIIDASSEFIPPLSFRSAPGDFRIFKESKENTVLYSQNLQDKNTTVCLMDDETLLGFLSYKKIMRVWDGEHMLCGGAFDPGDIDIIQEAI